MADTPLRFFMLLVYGGQSMIVFGGTGLDVIAKADIHILDLPTTTWTTGRPADASQARTNMAFTVFGDSFIAWGGKEFSILCMVETGVYRYLKCFINISFFLPLMAGESNNVNKDAVPIKRLQKQRMDNTFQTVHGNRRVRTLQPRQVWCRAKHFQANKKYRSHWRWNGGSSSGGCDNRIPLLQEAHYQQKRNAQQWK